MRRLLFTDLDGTVIFSHRRMEDSGDTVCVELLNGRRQSFMKRSRYERLAAQTEYRIVPVTTRTAEQFSRLSGLMNTFGWNDALICNGAVLLHDGVPDSGWDEASRKLAADEIPLLYDMRNTVGKFVPDENIIFSEPFMFYVRGEDAPSVYRFMKERAEEERLIIFADERKVYCIPRSFDKVNAAVRFTERCGESAYYAAGDGELDINMLKRAERCYAAEGLLEKLSDHGCCMPLPISD